MILRIIVALVFGPMIIAIGYWGGLWLYGMILFFAILGINEFNFADRSKYSFMLSIVSSLAVIYMIVMAINHSLAESAAIFIGFSLLVGMGMALQNKPTKELFDRYTSILWAVAYVGFLWPFIFHIRQVNPALGGDWLLFLFGSLWLGDSLAMFGGKAFGKRKLAPTVSPNKTIAGFFCGLSGGVIVAVILHFWRLESVELTHLIRVGILISTVGQFGDLVESMWKRATGIKDSSAIIPGHGGILDRFDSLLFSAPLLYYYMIFLIYK